MSRPILPATASICSSSRQSLRIRHTRPSSDELQLLAGLNGLHRLEEHGHCRRSQRQYQYQRLHRHPFVIQNGLHNPAIPQTSPPHPQHVHQQRRNFHDYFVTHLPSSSLHPDSRTVAGPRHHLPRSASEPHDSQSGARTPASMIGMARDTTVVRIPLKSAKHHFGANTARGTRPYNEDTYQAGTITLPAFAKRAPLSVRPGAKEGTVASGVDSSRGDPQVFYFGIFDGHGGDVCSHWLRDKLHGYLEESAEKFEMESTLQKPEEPVEKAKVEARASSKPDTEPTDEDDEGIGTGRASQIGRNQWQARESSSSNNTEGEEQGNPADTLQRDLIDSWSDTVGGYFVRFKPEYFSKTAGGQGKYLAASDVKNNQLETPPHSPPNDTSPPRPGSLEAVVSYSFLAADLDFVTGQNQTKPPPSPSPEKQPPDTSTATSTSTSTSPKTTPPPSQPFLGGSTASLALISTPTPIPFWHPSTPFTILTAHLGDTRILLCSTSTGRPVPLTSTHHPSDPGEAARLRRYAAAFTTDSFGEERISGLANTRAFGDRRSKRVGVSAEPQLLLHHATPSQYAFMVLVTDGITGVMSDQEIIDTVRECKTPVEGAEKVAGYAAEVAAGETGDADNCTAVFVRMGGWERRDEGGGGSVGTREEREGRRREAGEGRGGRGR